MFSRPAPQNVIQHISKSHGKIIPPVAVTTSRIPANFISTTCNEESPRGSGPAGDVDQGCNASPHAGNISTVRSAVSAGNVPVYVLSGRPSATAGNCDFYEVAHCKSEKEPGHSSIGYHYSLLFQNNQLTYAWPSFVTKNDSEIEETGYVYLIPCREGHRVQVPGKVER